ncbi:MAG: RidA family protein [Rhodospirillaceae bacterium]|nr:RidA family protein [Rhodospirillaceae bacterium]
MPGKIDARLKELGIVLPPAPAPAANYVPWVVSQGLVFVAGQIPLVDGKPQFVGKVGRDFTIEQGREAAKVCALNIVAQLKAACGGDLDKVARCAKVGAFVNCTPEFGDQPQVVNGASDLIVAVFGDAGKHARFAVGAPSLPRGVAVEVDAVFALKPAA